MQWGAGLGKVLDGPGAIEAAVMVERLGYDEVWVSNERFYRDMSVVLGAISMRTSHVRLGTFVADPFMVNPILTASAVATIDAISGGRAILGLGAGGSGFGQVGLAPRRIVVSMEKAIEATRALLAGEAVTSEDENFTLRDATLTMDAAPHIPIILASQSPKMLSLAGRVADAAIISTFADPALFARAMAWVAAGAREANRRFDPGTDVIARIDLSIDPDLDRARDALRPLIGYLMVLLHPRWDFLDVIGVEVSPELRSIAERGDYETISRRLELLPSGLIDAFGWVGTSEEVAEQVGRLTALGVRRFIVLPHASSGDVRQTLASFIRDVVPRVEAMT